MISNSNLPPYPRYTIFCLSDAIHCIFDAILPALRKSKPKLLYLFRDLFKQNTKDNGIDEESKCYSMCRVLYLRVHCNKLHMIHRIRKHFPMPFSDLPGISYWDSPLAFLMCENVSKIECFCCFLFILLI